MKQEHENSDFDKKLSEKFKGAEFTPPSFNRLMSGMQSELEQAWQNNFPKQTLSWKSILIYSCLVSFLLPLTLLRSDLKLTNQTVDAMDATDQHIAHHQHEKKSGLEHLNTTPPKLKQTGVATYLEGKKKNDSKQIAYTNKQTSFKILPLGKVIPKKNHKIFPSSHELNGNKTNQQAIGNQSETIASIQNSSLSIIDFVDEQAKLSHIDLLQTNAPKPPYEQLLLPNPKKGEFYVGLLGSVYSPWILNQNTYDAFNGYEFAYTFNLEQKVSVRAGYNSYGRLGVELGFVFNSHQGQHYEDHILGKFQTREIALDYWQVPVIMKYRSQARSTQHLPTTFNFEFGFVFNHLKSASEIINQNPGEDISNRFRKNMLQGVLGISADFYLSNRFYATIGARSLFSNDINADGWQVNDRYQKSHSIIFSANLGVSYRLTK